jgi:hypothetical protein
MKRFDNFVENILIQSGWYYERKEKLLVSNWKSQLLATDNLYMFPKAEEILLEFGGIKIEERENYSKQSFEINPTRVIYEGDRILEYADLLKINLYPLGESFGGYYFLVVSEDGRIYWLMDGIFIMGNNFDEALTKMILGHQPRLIEV